MKEDKAAVELVSLYVEADKGAYPTDGRIVELYTWALNAVEDAGGNAGLALGLLRAHFLAEPPKGGEDVLNRYVRMVRALEEAEPEDGPLPAGMV